MFYGWFGREIRSARVDLSKVAAGVWRRVLINEGSRRFKLEILDLG